MFHVLEHAAPSSLGLLSFGRDSAVRGKLLALFEGHQAVHLLKRELKEHLPLLELNVFADLGVLVGEHIDLLRGDVAAKSVVQFSRELVGCQ